MPYNQLDKDPTGIKGTCITEKAKVFQYTTRTGLKTMLVDITDSTYTIWDTVVQVNL